MPKPGEYNTEEAYQEGFNYGETLANSTDVNKELNNTLQSLNTKLESYFNPGSDNSYTNKLNLLISKFAEYQNTGNNNTMSLNSAVAALNARAEEEKKEKTLASIEKQQEKILERLNLEDKENTVSRKLDEKSKERGEDLPDLLNQLKEASVFDFKKIKELAMSIRDAEKRQVKYEESVRGVGLKERAELIEKEKKQFEEEHKIKLIENSEDYKKLEAQKAIIKAGTGTPVSGVSIEGVETELNKKKDSRANEDDTNRIQGLLTSKVNIVGITDTAIEQLKKTLKEITLKVEIQNPQDIVPASASPGGNIELPVSQKNTRNVVAGEKSSSSLAPKPSTPGEPKIPTSSPKRLRGPGGRFIKKPPASSTLGKVSKFAGPALAAVDVGMYAYNINEIEERKKKGEISERQAQGEKNTASSTALGATMGGVLGASVGMVAATVTGGAMAPLIPYLAGVGGAIGGGAVGSSIGSTETVRNLFSPSTEERKPLPGPSLEQATEESETETATIEASNEPAPVPVAITNLNNKPEVMPVYNSPALDRIEQSNNEALQLKESLTEMSSSMKELIELNKTMVLRSSTEENTGSNVTSVYNNTNRSVAAVNIVPNDAQGRRDQVYKFVGRTNIL